MSSYLHTLFAERCTTGSGIVSLMHDLGTALAGSGEKIMLGGGNPSHIPAVEARFRTRMQALLDTPGEFERIVGNYQAPVGNERFIEALAELFKKRLGWDVTPGNIALSPGSQASFFALFNLLAGPCRDGSQRHVLFPMAPEYIGYADLGLDPGMLLACKPEIDLLDDNLFKYRVDFNNLRATEPLGALCLSRPTNPTGNVVSDDELDRLIQFAQSNNVPLIIDSAYGAPFPNILFRDVKLVWNEQLIICMSLSKIGLPGVRTGIVIARADIITALASVNAILNLAGGNLGPALTYDLVASGELLDLSLNTIRPYYQQRATQTLAAFRAALSGLNYRIHQPEGAIFLWLWFPDLPISSQELYQRLKQRGVLVVSGHHFFPGLREPWRHAQECIRVTYSQEPELVQQGIGIIADEVRRAYAS